MEGMKGKKEGLSKTAASGMVALVFLVLGFQTAVFVLKVLDRSPGGSGKADSSGPVVAEPVVEAPGQAGGDRGNDVSPDRAGRAVQTSSAGNRTGLGGYGRPRNAGSPRQAESFPFDPNSISIEDLQRLGLSERQAESIGSYRAKGGRFRSKEDFRKMYVVSDTLFARLEPFIEIPKLELNTADSAALVSLRGIGPWYARKIMEYRERLGGFYSVEQLLEIDGIDSERLAGFAGDVTADAELCRKLDIWKAADSVLAVHPYLGQKGARSIVRYRQLYDSLRWSAEDLAKERVLSNDNIEKLKKYIEIQ